MRWPLWWAQPPGAAIYGAPVPPGVDAHVQGIANPMCFEKWNRHIWYLAHFSAHWVPRVHGRKALTTAESFMELQNAAFKQEK